MSGLVPRRQTCRAGGFTLIEVVVVLAVAGILTTVAWPSWQGHLQRARRADALAALTRLQTAQESYRNQHGGYSGNLLSLAGATSRSLDGFYDLALQGPGGDSVTLTARARAGTAQSRDTDCPEITLQLRQGFAEAGPNSRCWNR